MVKLLVAILIVAATAMFVCLPAAAQLMPTSFGFPTIVQSGSTIAFNQDLASAVNQQSVNVNFPTLGGGLPFGPVSLAFPSISQTSLQTQSVAHTSFSQSNQFAEFAFPFAGVGATGLPGFGF